MAVLGFPYLLLDANAAYVLHLLLLFLANAAYLALAAALAHQAAAEVQEVERTDSRVIDLLGLECWWRSCSTGYPFFFSVERGNTDIFAVLFGTAAIWIATQRRDALWLTVILMSVAVHIKVYPVLLFPILLYVQGRRTIVPSLVTNLAVLSSGDLPMWPIAGQPAVLRCPADDHGEPLRSCVLALSDAWAWPAGRRASAAAMAFHRTPPVALGQRLARDSWRLPSQKQGISAAFMLTLPVTSLIPGISYDYQLVVLSAAVVVLLSSLLVRMARRQDVSTLSAPC